MKKKYFRIAFWSEMLILFFAVVLFIAPLRFGITWFGMNPNQMVMLYYAASLIMIAVAQVIYMFPFSRFSVTNRKSYAAGLVILFISLHFWLRGGAGRTLSFSGLDKGELLAPIVFALALTFIHGFISFSFTTLKTPIDANKE